MRAEMADRRTRKPENGSQGQFEAARECGYSPDTLRKRNWCMDSKTRFATAPSSQSRCSDRRADSDRRAYSDRRRSGGLFDVRARREQSGYDRRQGDRRERGRSWLGRWLRER